MQASPGIRYSLVLHAVLLALLIFGLPAWFESQRDPEPVVISVEMLPITGKTNIKPSSAKKAPTMQQPKEQPKPVEKEAPKPPQPTTPTTANTPPPPPKETVKEDAPKEKKETPKPKEEKPKPKPKEEPKEDDLSAILKSVATAAKREEKKTPPNPKPAEENTAPNEADDTPPNNSTSYDSSMPLSMSETDAIMSQLAKCWSPPAGARDAHDLRVVISAQFNTDGSVIAVALAKDQGRYGSDPFFRAAADSAIRAVKRCSPLKALPADKYGTWRDMELNFDPRTMLY